MRCDGSRRSGTRGQAGAGTSCVSFDAFSTHNDLREENTHAASEFRRKRRPARSASPPCPTWWRSSSSWASRWPCESGAGDAANFADDTYRAAGAEVAAHARPSSGPTADIVFKVRAPSADEVALMREGGTLIGFIWPAQNPELMQQLAARKATVLAIDCAAAPAVARAEDGRADLDGRHQRLPRGDRGGQRLRPLLQRPDHRRRQDPAGQGVHRRRRRGRPGRHRHGRQPGRHRARQRHPRRGGRPGGVAGRRVRQGRLRGRRLGRRRLRQGDERGLPAGPARDVRQAGQGSRHHHHHRADPGQAGAQADHRRDGAEHEARQRHRRHGRPSRAATASSPCPARRWCATASPSSATPTWSAAWPSSRRRCTRPTCCA